MINDKVADIIKFKDLLDADNDNDYYLFQFIAKVLELSGEKGVLTDIGFRILENNLITDLNKINEDAHLKKPSQKPIIRAVLYLTIAYNISLLFGGFVNISLKDTPLLNELKEYLIKIEERSSKLLPIIEGHLKKLLSLLTDKYAKSFDTIKRSCFTKDLFNSVDRIPAHPKDLPASFRYETAVELPSA